MLSQPTNYGCNNAGSSCFLNAAVQGIFHTQPLREYFETHKTQYPDGSVTRLLIDHLENLQNTNKTKAPINPWTFRQNVVTHSTASKSINKMASGQRDAQAFLNFLFERLVGDLTIQDKTYIDLTSALTHSNNVAITQSLKQIFNNRTQPVTLIVFKKLIATKIGELETKNLFASLSDAVTKKADSIEKILTAMSKHPEERIKMIADIRLQIFKMLGKNQFCSFVEEYFAIRVKAQKEKMGFKDKQQEIEEKLTATGQGDNIKKIVQEKYINIVKPKDELDKNATYQLYNLVIGGIILTDAAKKRLTPDFSIDLFVEIRKNLTTKDFATFYTSINGVLAQRNVVDSIFRVHPKYEKDPTRGLKVNLPDGKGPFNLTDLIAHNPPKDPLPPILIVFLVRVGFDGSGIKRTDIVHFDQNILDMTQYETGAYYEPYAIAIHLGSTIDSGHYYTYAKHPTLNMWFDYDDTSITPKTDTEIKNLISPTTESDETPYLIFYKRKTTNLLQGPLTLLRERLNQLKRTLSHLS